MKPVSVFALACSAVADSSIVMRGNGVAFAGSVLGSCSARSGNARYINKQHDWFSNGAF